MMVVVIVADSLRADAPGFAGGTAATPLLDDLAGDGSRFETAVASGSWTVPSLLSMVTGAFPHRLGVCRWRHPFPARRPTLMSAFAAAGFDVRTLTFNPRWSFGNCPSRGAVGDSQDPARVVEALGGPRGRDRLVLIHHWWTHLPYLTQALDRDGWLRACDALLRSLARRPDTQAARFRALYDRALAHFSAELLGRYLDAATEGGEPALVVITGDHGENWGECLPAGRRVEHIYDLHGRWLADATARVPLVLWGQGADGPIPAGAVLGGTVRGVDVGPTVADLAGIPWPGPLPSPDTPFAVDRGILPDGQGLRLDGRSVAGAVLGGADAPAGEALVVASHNTYQPRVYPSDGRQLWRTFGLRTDDAWFRFDGPGGGREVLPRPGREQAADADAERAWDVLERAWSDAVGPAGVLPAALFPRFRGGRMDADFDGEPATVPAPPPDDPGEGDPLVRRMRTLGYLD